MILEEFDFDTTGYNFNYDQKKLTASILKKSVMSTRSYGRKVLGELDYKIYTNQDGTNNIQVDDYAAANTTLLKNLFMFLENRAIANNGKSIDMLNYSYKELPFLEELGYTCYAKENNIVSAWAKTKLGEQKFNASIKDLDKIIESQETEK